MQAMSWLGAVLVASGSGAVDPGPVSEVTGLSVPGVRFESAAVSLPSLTRAGTTAEEAEGTGDLARATQNPVADLISLPLQNNFNFDVGEDDDMQYVLNVQPVVPIHASDDYNIINRAILPIIDQPDLGPNLDGEFGFGDLQYTAFLSPTEPVGGVIIGAGPVFVLPTASDEVLGSGKWSAGPSAVALKMEGPWVYGALVQQVWSFAGSGRRQDVSQFLVQPFVNYNLEDGWYLVSAPILTANWEADKSGDVWNVPLGGGVGKIFKVGPLPVNGQVQGFYNVHSPDSGPRWGFRLQIQFLFPKKKPPEAALH